jgi:Fic family protein
MKIPPRPPEINPEKDPALIGRILPHYPRYGKATDARGRYLHWNKISHQPMPGGISAEDYWGVVKLARLAQSKNLPLRDKYNKPFVFCAPDPLQDFLHWIDTKAGGAIRGGAESRWGRDFHISGLVDEAIHSSILEGATTTRRVAKEMIRSGRAPENKSERMILNNFAAMRLIDESEDDQLTAALILKLHRILTDGTMDDPADCGRLRRRDDIVVQDNATGDVLHEPPPAAELEKRIKALCDFANGKTPKEYFIHPALRAMLAHFQLAYDHPFVDGNGRTARALFYWLMAKRGYWLVKYASISRIIVKASAQYGYAFLHAETDGNDATYFLMHQSGVLRRAVDDLHAHIARQADERRKVEAALHRARIRRVLNHRQIALLEYALRHPDESYSIAGHRAAHGVGYQTARSDLSALAKAGLLRRQTQKGKKKYVFIAPPDLPGRLGVGV